MNPPQLVQIPEIEYCIFKVIKDIPKEGERILFKDGIHTRYISGIDINLIEGVLIPAIIPNNLNSK